MAKTYNLFISHSWTYGNAYENFCSLLNNDSNFSYRNYSVPKDDPVHDADREVRHIQQVGPTRDRDREGGFRRAHSCGSAMGQ